MASNLPPEDDQSDLPPKPPITEPMPSDQELADMPEPDDEPLDEDEFLPSEKAEADPTVDNAEGDL